MKPKTLYLLLCVMGLVIPYAQLVPWLIEHRSLSGFLPAMFSNQISKFFVADVLVSALVLVVLMAVERKRLAVRALWAPVVALLTVGVSLALPLYLLLREQEMEKTGLR